MLLQLVRSVAARCSTSQADLIPVLNPCLKLRWISDNWGGDASAEMVRGWVIEQVSLFPLTRLFMAATRIYQMLEFKMASLAIGANAGVPSTAYKVVAERSTSAISSGLDRLFGRTVHENSASVASRQRQEWEVSTDERRGKARTLEDVRRELDNYLEEELETFSRIERVNGIEQRAVFDLLAYWQVVQLSPSPVGN